MYVTDASVIKRKKKKKIKLFILTQQEILWWVAFFVLPHDTTVLGTLLDIFLVALWLLQLQLACLYSRQKEVGKNKLHRCMKGLRSDLGKKNFAKIPQKSHVEVLLAGLVT